LGLEMAGSTAGRSGRCGQCWRPAHPHRRSL